MHNHNFVKLSTFCAFLILGIIEASWAPMIPYIKARFSLDEATLGNLLLCVGTGAFLALPLAGTLCTKVGCRRLVTGSTLLLATALFIVSASGNVYLAAAALLCFGMATIGMDIGINVNAVMVETNLKKPLMSGFHGGYSLGSLTGSALTTLLLTVGLGVFPIASMLWVFAVVTVFTLCSGLYSGFGSTHKKEGTQGSVDAGGVGSRAAPAPGADQSAPARLLPPALVLVAGFLCFIMYCAEGAVMGWSGVFANQERGLDLKHAGLMFTMFACAMVFMRFIGNRLVSKMGRRRTVVTGSVVVCLGFVMVAAVPHLAAAVAGFVIIGLGAANIIPQLISFAGGIRGYPVNRTITFVNAVGYGGVLAGPVIIGHIAAASSIATAFLGISALVLLVGVVSFVIMRPLPVSGPNPGAHRHPVSSLTHNH